MINWLLSNAMGLFRIHDTIGLINRTQAIKNLRRTEQHNNQRHKKVPNLQNPADGCQASQHYNHNEEDNKYINRRNISSKGWNNSRFQMLKLGCLKKWITWHFLVARFKTKISRSSISRLIKLTLKTISSPLSRPQQPSSSGHQHDACSYAQYVACHKP